MSNEPTSNLHLPDLSIRNFRGIKSLSIGRLGRVTLIAGRNGVGKSTILEAVRIFAARGHRMELAELLSGREELLVGYGKDDEPVLLPNFAALFYDRTATPDTSISIGAKSGANALSIRALTFDELPGDIQKKFDDTLDDQNRQIIEVAYNGFKDLLIGRPFPYSYDPRFREVARRLRRSVKSLGSDDQESISVISFEVLGPGIPSNSMLSRFWDSVVLTDREPLALEALGMVVDGIQGVAVVGDPDVRRLGRSAGRRLVVRHNGHSAPVPLKSLGDGATRLFAAGLALANCRDGFLIVDEVENGIHYTLQQSFWTMILRAARQYNIQVFATTHSHDCVKGFAKAAKGTEEAEGLLVRLEAKDGGVQVIEYNEVDLETAADQGIEVR